MGINTNHPEASGLNVKSGGSILFGAQASNTTITGTDSTMTLTYGGGALVMKAHGGSDQLKLETGGLTAKSLVHFKGGIKVDGNPGKSTQIVYHTNLKDRRKMTFVYGILVKDENN